MTSIYDPPGTIWLNAEVVTNPKNMIHQIYGTHCTSGTSALERRQGNAALRDVGCSIRAGSLAGSELREHFQATSRYLNYRLPSDASDDLVLRLDPNTAPRRFFYCLTASGMRILGQVCFRKEDCSTPPRLGSYFGHLLTGLEVRDAWSILDCLRLWNAAGWRTADGADIPYDLKPFQTFDEVLSEFHGERPAPDYDALLARFS